MITTALRHEADASQARRRDDARRQLRAGEPISLADAVDHLPPGDWPRWPSMRFIYIAGECAAGEMVASALGVDPARPLVRLDVPADAWPSARLVPDDFELRNVEVLGAVKLFEVQIRLPAAGEDRDLEADLSLDHELEAITQDPAAAFLPVALPVAPAELDTPQGRLSFQSAPIPGALAAAAAWIVEQGRVMDAGELRGALAAFGLQLDDSGQAITNSPDAADGSLRDGSAGRRPLLARQLVEALAAKRMPGAVITVAAEARTARTWLAERFPSLTLPTMRTFERSLSRRNFVDEP